MHIVIRVLSAIASVVLATFLLGFVGAYGGRASVFVVAVASLVALAVVRRRRVLGVPWVWTAAVALGAGLAVLPYDVRFDPDFPPGVYVRPAVWGLLMNGVPEDENGVPEFWWARSCIVPMNAPEKVIVFGYGDRRPGGTIRVRSTRETVVVEEASSSPATETVSQAKVDSVLAGFDLR